MTEQQDQPSPQDGILPERDARRNSPEEIRMRAAVTEDWYREYPHAEEAVPDFDLDLLTLVNYHGGPKGAYSTVQITFMEALILLADDYIREVPFMLANADSSKILAFYDGDVLRSEFNRRWLLSHVQPAVHGLLRLISLGAQDANGSLNEELEDESSNDELENELVSSVKLNP